MPRLAAVTRMVKETAEPRRRIDIRYLDDLVFFDAEGAYTIVSIPCRTWDMLSPREKQRAFGGVYATLNGLPRGHVHHCRLITARFPFNADLWAERLNNWVAERTVPTHAWPTFMGDTRDKLNARRWPVKRVYLIIRLGDRINYEGRWEQLSRKLRRTNDWIGLGDEMPREAEVSYWHEQATDVRTSTAQSRLRCQPVSGREMEMLLLHLTHPDLAAPDPVATAPKRYGPGEIRTLLGGEITRVPMGTINQYKYECLRHDTLTGTSYQVWFALSQAPDEFTFPDVLWLDSPTSLPFPIVQSIGFEILEQSATRKDADKINRAIDEQFYNDAEAGVATDLSIHEKKSRATAMKYAADRRVPFLRLRALWGISASNPRDLTDRARAFIRHMREDAGGFTVDAPPRNQRRFFYEHLPTGQAADHDYLRRIGLDYLAAGMPHISASVGEGQGPYQGFTIDQQGNPAEPVFNDAMLYATTVEKAPTEAVPGDPGGGKRLDLDTIVPTPEGFKTIRDLRVGDRLFDERGAGCSITMLHPIEENPAAYRITFDDGTIVQADAEHRWTTETRASRVSAARLAKAQHGRRHKRVIPETRTTAEIAATLHASDGRANHSIPIPDPARYQERELPLDPYLLGVWLGDGHADGSGAITTEDPEIIDAFIIAGFTVRQIKNKGTCQDFYIAGLPTALRPLGVVDNKHVPDDYLFGSVDQRLALLQGLMDTDGSVKPRGACEFYASDEPLARQVRSLIASLGMKASLRSKDSGYGAVGGDTVRRKTAYTVAFTPNEKVVRLQRKLERLNISARRTTTRRRYITAVDPVAPVPMRCITVDSPSHLFLVTDQYIPTHNTVSRGFRPVHEDALRGITQAVKDPKGDYLVFAEHADELGLDPERVTVVNVLSGESGMLDPASLAATPGEVAPLMRSTLRRLVPDLLVSADAPKYRDCIANAVNAAVAEKDGQGQYLGRVVQIMQHWAAEQPSAEHDTELLANSRILYGQLARRFNDIANHPQGKLLFGRSRQRYRVPEGQLVIFCTLGLAVPPAGVPRKDLEEAELIGDVISGLMMDYIWDLMARLPDEVPKAITWDEFHMDKDNPRVEVLVDRVKRIARAKNTLLRLISQSSGDFPPGFITAVYAFGSADRPEAEKTCDLLRVEKSDENVEMIQALADTSTPKGMCIIRDRDGSIARVQIEFIYDWLLELFSTNPEKRRLLVAKYLGEDAVALLEQMESDEEADADPAAADDLAEENDDHETAGRDPSPANI